ncbi:MAG TPA: glycosyltransferase [Chloroflexota bacterium]|nr:glycosyltransferase [Chloroflexota bacterium]
MHVVPSLDQEMGGSLQAALLMNEALVPLGVDSSIRTTVGPDDQLAWIGEEFDFISYEAFRRRFPHHYYRSPALSLRLRREAAAVDVVHVHGFFNFPAAYGLVAGSSCGTTIVASPHGQLDPYDLRRHRFAKRLYARGFLRRALESVATTVVTSDREGAELQTFGVPVTTRTVGLPVRPLPSGSGQRLRDRFGIPRDAVIVLFLGRLHPKKRLDIVLRSVARLRSRFGDLHTLVVGDGDPAYLRKLRSLSADLGSEPFTTWAGTLRGQDKADALDASDLFALTSENENFGITIVEALLAGVPVLISDKVYLDGILQKEGLATVCQTTVDSCTSALGSLVDDPVALRARAPGVRKLARDLFAPENVAERLLETYQLARRTRHGF